MFREFYSMEIQIRRISILEDQNSSKDVIFDGYDDINVASGIEIAYRRSSCGL